MTTKQWWAVVDSENATGAVYGVGPSQESARLDAKQVQQGVSIVRCSPEAAAYVEEHGGAPSPRLRVTGSGVTFVPETES